MGKRFLSVVLALMLVITMAPVQFIFAAGGTGVPEIKVGTAFGKPGGEVKVDVKIRNNPGILGATLTLNYDSELTLINAESGPAFADLAFTKPGKFVSPCNFVWDGLELSGDDAQDGVVMSLTFKVDENASLFTSHTISLSAGEDMIQGADMESIDVSFSSGSIKVIDYIPGDVDGDSKVTIKDIITLRQYIAGGYGVVINTNAGNVDENNSITTADIITMRRVKAGGYKDKDGEDLELKPAPMGCAHQMEKLEDTAASCTEDGHIACWHCTICGKYFSNQSGTNELAESDVLRPATGHTFASGWSFDSTYHWHAAICEHTEVRGSVAEHTFGADGLCTVCGAGSGEDPTRPYRVIYNLYEWNRNKGDTYLETQTIDNSINQVNFSVSDSFDLKNLDGSAIGYEFLGWFDNSGTKVTKIEKGTAHDVTVYAHWQENTYDVTYVAYNTPMSPITDTRYTKYQTRKGLADLPNPELDNYVFLGWYDNNGEKVDRINTGSVGDIELHAYWTSKRCLTTAVHSDDPIVVHDTSENVIYMIYEIGKIENVPLKKPYWVIQNVAGLSQTISEQQSKTIEQSEADTIATQIADQTVDSSSWTFAEDWNEKIEVNEEWAEQNGMTQAEATTKTRTKSNTTAATSFGEHTLTDETKDGTTVVTYDSQNEKRGNSADFKLNIGGGKTTEADIAIAKATTDFHIDFTGEYEQHKDTDKHTGSDTTTVNTTTTHKTAAYKNSSSTHHDESQVSNTVSQTLSKIISQKTGYGRSYINGGSNTNTQGFSTTTSESQTRSNTITYVVSEDTTVTKTYSADGKVEGCYRLVLSGTFNVFGIVSYDVAKGTFALSTYSILDESSIDEFLDYAPDKSFSDHDRNVLPFEVPYSAYEIISKSISRTEGLEFQTNLSAGTAVVSGYEGSDTDILVPSYISSNGKAYKVVGIDSDAFAGKNIRAIILSSYIESIPDGAFKNCTNLEQISGYFTKIGAEAFSGCVNLEGFTISESVSSVGKNAFAGVPAVKANILSDVSAMDLAGEGDATNAGNYTRQLIEQVLACGASSITMDLSNIIDMDGIVLNVPEMTKFELLGGSRTFEDLKIVSEADETILRDIRIDECTRIPLDLRSNAVTFESVRVESPGFGMLLANEGAIISLVHDTTFVSGSGKAVVWGNPVLNSIKVDGISGSLILYGNDYVYGSITGGKALQHEENGESISITAEEFAKYLKGVYSVILEPVGGTCDLSVIQVSLGDTFGTLPKPTKEHYQFIGWFTLPGGGQQVYPSTLFDNEEIDTLYARWVADSYTASWDTPAHCTITVRRTASPYAGVAAGNLNSGDIVFYGDVLNITYTADSGYSISDSGYQNIVVNRNYTSSDIYCSTDGEKVTYNVVYQSSNGANLGSDIASYKIGTTNTITPKIIEGYATPAAQTVAWDTTDKKTITFIYTPNSVGSKTLKNEAVWYKSPSGNGVRYTVKVEFSNRTENSVKAKITWTNKILAGSYFGYTQSFKMTIGGAATGSVQICDSSTWASSSSSARTKTVTKTITITGLEATTNSLSYKATPAGSSSPDAFSGTLTIPTF